MLFLLSRSSRKCQWGATESVQIVVHHVQCTFHIFWTVILKQNIGSLSRDYIIGKASLITLCIYVRNRPFQVRTREQASLRCNSFIKNVYNFFKVYIGKSTYALPTLLVLALGSPLNNRFCRCAGIVLQVANRVADVCGESVIYGITSELSMQGAWLSVRALVNVKWFDFNKRDFFLVLSIWLYPPCHLHPFRYSLWRGVSVERMGTLLL